MKVWITKYALTEKGIIEDESAELYGNNGLIKSNTGRYFREILSKKDWHSDKATAVGVAEKMRVKKIESLKKQIKKLETMEF